MNKEKILKILIIIILVLLVLFFINRLYTSTIIYKTYSTMLSKAEENNFYVKRTNVIQNSTTVLETYIKDGIYKKSLIMIQNGSDNNTTIRTLDFWRNNIENIDNKYYLIIGVDNEKTLAGEGNLAYEKEPQNKMYKYDFSKSLVIGNGELNFYEDEEYTFKEIFIYTLKNTFGEFWTNVEIFSDKKDCYKLHYSGTDLYISKDTYLPVFALGNDGYGVYEYYTKDITEEDIKEPDVSECKVPENN